MEGIDRSTKNARQHHHTAHTHTPAETACARTHPRQEKVLALHRRLPVTAGQRRRRQPRLGLQVCLHAEFLQDSPAPFHRQSVVQHLPGQVGAAGDAASERIGRGRYETSPCDEPICLLKSDKPLAAYKKQCAAVPRSRPASADQPKLLQSTVVRLSLPVLHPELDLVLARK